MIPKPGKKKKNHTQRQPPPKRRYCRRCGIDNGDCAWRHAESRIIKFQHGGGIMGGKIPKSQTAWICAFCDSILSKPLPKDATQEELEKHAKDWLVLIKLSHQEEQ